MAAVGGAAANQPHQQQHALHPQAAAHASSTGYVVHQAWFLGAPWTKFIVVGQVLIYVVAHSRKATNFIPAWMAEGARPMSFGSMGELFVGSCLLAFWMKRFEREMGSRKMFVFLVQTWFFAVVLLEQFILLFLPPKFTLAYGPYPWLGSLSYLYHVYTPRLHPRLFGVLGFSGSEKSFTYAALLQLVYASGWRVSRNSLIPLICGMGAAMMASSSTMSNLWNDVPSFLVSWVDWLELDRSPPIFAPALQPQQAQRADRGVRPVRGAMRQQNPRPGGAPVLRRGAPSVAAAAAEAGMRREAAVAQPPPQPDPAAIEQLTAIGFERSRVVAALQATNNNVEQAADRLLSS